MVLGRTPILLALLAQLGAAIGGRTEIPFGRGWRWHRGDAPDGPGLGSGALSGFHNVTSCTNTHKMDGWAPQGDKSAGYPPGVTSCGIACSYDDSCTAFSDGHGYCAHGFADSVCNGTGGPRAHVMQRGPGVGFQRNFSFAATDFDDSGWKLATLPHDPLINQTFDPAAGEGSGFVPRKVIWYGPLNYRTATRTLFLRPYLAHFYPVFSRCFAVFSVLTPGFQKVAPKDRRAVP